MTSVHDFARFKAEGRKISLVTASDTWSAAIVGRSQVDAILVGDSVAMVQHGHATTLRASVAMMAVNTSAVARSAAGKLTIADLPSLSFRQGVAAAVTAVGALVTSGAHAVKVAGVDGHEEVIRQVIGTGVPVMGHIGLTPESITQFGNVPVDGHNDPAATMLRRQAQVLEDLGCFSVVLECVPAALATRITARLSVPTIGIGAGAGTDGQALAFQDLLGRAPDHAPGFVRRDLEANRLLIDALDRFDADVKQARFPAPARSGS